MATELAQEEIFTAFGTFWSRDEIEWRPTPKILGMKQVGAESVDFSRQGGIYLLYDGRKLIHVGKSTDRDLGQCLYEHTKNRLSTRGIVFPGSAYCLSQKKVN